MTLLTLSPASDYPFEPIVWNCLWECENVPNVCYVCILGGVSESICLMCLGTIEPVKCFCNWVFFLIISTLAYSGMTVWVRISCYVQARTWLHGRPHWARISSFVCNVDTCTHSVCIYACTVYWSWAETYRMLGVVKGSALESAEWRHIA